MATVPEPKISAPLPQWSRLAGLVFFVGTAILFGRLVWEQTVFTWERGPQMVGYSLAHGPGAILLLFPFLLFGWTGIVIVQTAWAMVKRKRVAVARWAGAALIFLLFIAGTLPEGFWQRAFIERMAASPHAADLLLAASYRADLRTVQALVTHGVPATAAARADGQTALHGAAVAGDLQAIRYLVSKGANVNAPDHAGKTPLQLAEAAKQPAAAKLLTSLGAKPAAPAAQN